MPGSGSASRGGNHGNERTPLLLPTTSGGGLEEHEEAVLEDGEIEAAAEIGGPGFQPGHAPDLSKIRSYSHSHWLAPDEDTGSAVEPEGTTKQSPFLGGVSKARFWLIFIGILFAYFIALFDSTLMASSHPVITSYFNASNSASWLSTSFLLTSTALQPLFGRISDTVGRRPIYLLGLLSITATTAWCALAQSIGSFIAARAFCGLSAGGILAMGSIMTNDLVSIEVRGTYQAYINLFYGLGSASGAAFGGFLCDRIGWRWTFGVQIPPLVAVFVLAFFTTPASLGPNLAKTSGKGVLETIKSFDLAGSFFLTTSVAFLILGLNLGGNVYLWSHPLVITSLVVAFFAGLILIRVESRAARPVMPLKMLSSKPRANIVFSNFSATAGINAIIFNAPLYFQAVKLDTPSVSGFRLAGPSLLLTICGVSSGLIMTSTGRMKELFVSGSLCMLLGSICLSSMWDGIPTWLATIFVCPSSIGQGLAFPASSIAVLATSSQEDQAVMTTTLTLWRSLGTVMGVSLSSLVLQNSLSAYLNDLVTGAHKDEIIWKVRKSVRALLDLDQQHQHQVIDAYSRSLRVTFISSIVLFLIVNALALPVKLPRLGRK
ncbi:MFS general substrate transporter [Mytilinidion resinicola]|uniref:MFS general substrate transporter n=1 Tax=Mytilinidion resinicola TaxID=574789 RepID=A0A6A6YYZ3_9PEZI|nr:MFS general substrate transporter [Mytilinidion resinicola]KAF2813177.1 MFS general substrate transporter [Mytilinidion resinicola]